MCILPMESNVIISMSINRSDKTATTVAPEIFIAYYDKVI